MDMLLDDLFNIIIVDCFLMPHLNLACFFTNDPRFPSHSLAYGSLFQFPLHPGTKGGINTFPLFNDRYL